MSISEAMSAIPKRFLPYLAVAILTAGAATAWAQLQGRVNVLETVGSPVQRRIESKVNWLIWKSGGDPAVFDK